MSGRLVTRAIAAGFALAAALAGGARAQGETPAPAARPFVPGGYDDKPYVSGLFGRIAIGGYFEVRSGWELADGVTEEGGIELKRWNLLTTTRVSKWVRVWAEVEFEDGGQEIKLELAQLDLELDPAINLRAGMLLLPLGRFNLAHDGPRNEFIDRPLLATDLVGSALSMPGLGLFGRLGSDRGRRATWELYAVNGYDDGLLLDSPDGTRLPAGAANFEDNNASPAVVSRVAFSPSEAHEFGLSGYAGAYNTYQVDGTAVDERRSVRVATLDARTRLAGLDWNAEASLVEVDIPPGLAGLFASRQAGCFLEAAWTFARGRVRAMPASSATLAARAEGVDFDRDLQGDSIRQLTLGLNFRPTPESALKLDYRRGESRDRFNNAAQHAAVLFGLTTYF